MSGDTYDVQGEVRDALNTAVEGYGKRVLNDPRVLGNLVTDLLPDLPRERSLLVTGAEAGVADELTQHVESQRMDADTAVALVARSLSESRALEPAAGMWVATEYAKALGYQVRSQVPPSVEAPADTPPWPPHDETQTANQGRPPLFPPPGPTAGQTPPMYPPPGQMPPGSPPPSPWPATPKQRQRKSRLGLFLGGGAAAVIVLYLVIAAVASTFPFTKAKPTPTPSPGTTSPSPRTTSPSPGATSPSPGSTSPSPGATSPSPGASGTLAALPAGLKPLKVLLPTDIQDASTECVDQTNIKWTNPGLVKADVCNAPDMPNGAIFGYQLDNSADYQKAWANYNTWANFGTSKSLNCPPAAGQSQGGPGEWEGPRFPQLSGQVLECFNTDSGPVYVWTYPTENAFIIAQPDKSWTFSKLETWWENNSV